jgi:hypothetical protein
MLVMSKRQSAFVKQSDNAYAYRFIKEIRYNWRKLLLLSATALIQKIQLLHKYGEHRLLIYGLSYWPLSIYI